MNLSTHVVGLLFAASALLSWTSLSFFVRLAMKNAPLLRTTACMSTMNGVFVAVLVFFTLPASAFQAGLTRTWILLPITAFFMITISRLTYYYAIRRIGPSRTIPIAASTPAVTALLATIFLGEPFTFLIILGLLCLILGLNMVVRSAPAQPNLELGHTRKDVVKGYISAGLTTLNWSVSGVMVRTITLDMNALAASALLIWIGLGFAWVLAVGFAHRETA
ncbi:MAG: DMT family transporter, partial [Nitrospinae bacterium]|nr:DMT family transporter [Nitrospinota bacterium]